MKIYDSPVLNITLLDDSDCIRTSINKTDTLFDAADFE